MPEDRECHSTLVHLLCYVIIVNSVGSSDPCYHDDDLFVLLLPYKLCITLCLQAMELVIDRCVICPLANLC